MKKSAFEIINGKDLTGKVYLVTGGYSGLGAITSEALLSANATVIVTGRNRKSQNSFLEELKAKSKFNIDDNQVDISHTLDLADLSSVHEFGTYVKNTYKKIDGLINNAGVMFTPPGKTKDGFEVQFGTNVIGHFLLSKLLVDITKRQIWLSSKGHTRLGSPRIDLEAVKELDASNYNTTLRYQQSKLGNILLAKYFNDNYDNLTAVAVHPGVVKTNLSRHMSLGKKLMFTIKHPLAIFSMKEPEEGAATQVLTTILPENELVGGAYYADCAVAQESESAQNMKDAKDLFDFCDLETRAFQ